MAVKDSGATGKGFSDESFNSTRNNWTSDTGLRKSQLVRYMGGGAHWHEVKAAVRFGLAGTVVGLELRYLVQQ
jgi:hypothetical protein